MKSLNLLGSAAVSAVFGFASQVLAQCPTSFATATITDGGPVPTAMRVADLNHDGHADAIVANGVGNGTVSVRLGNGTGTLGTRTTFTVAATPVDIELADFNQDGHLDVAVACYDSGGCSILLGNGSGSFGPAPISYVFTGSRPGTLVAAFLDGDEYIDLAVGKQDGTISILSGDGAGGFIALPNVVVASGANITGLAAAHLDTDENLDLVVSSTSGCCGAGTGTILYGDGFGEFPTRQTGLATGNNPSSIAAADMNADGLTDLVVANANGAVNDTVRVLVALEGGGFASPALYSVGSSPQQLVVADISGDGILDILTVDHDSNAVALLRGQGAGLFPTVASQFSVAHAPISLTLGDLNGDGRIDVLAGSSPCCGDTNRLSVLSNTFRLPAITMQPEDLDACQPGSVVLATAATSMTAVSFQWTKDGIALDEADPRFTGTTSSQLEISPVLIQDSGAYTCVLTNACGSVTSRIAHLDVTLCCPADYNSDGDADILDFLDFMNDFSSCDNSSGPCGDTGNADHNGDTTVDIIDFLDFLQAFSDGC